MTTDVSDSAALLLLHVDDHLLLTVLLLLLTALVVGLLLKREETKICLGLQSRDCHYNLSLAKKCDLRLLAVIIQYSLNPRGRYLLIK